MVSVCSQMVDLAGSITRLEATGLYDGLASDIRSSHWRVAFLGHCIESPIAKGQLQLGSLILQEHKLVPGQFRGTCKIDKIKALTDVEVTRGLLTLCLLTLSDEIIAKVAHQTILRLVANRAVIVSLIRQLEGLLYELMLEGVKDMFPVLDLLLVSLANLGVGP